MLIHAENIHQETKTVAREYDPHKLSSPRVYLFSMVVFIALVGFLVLILYRQILEAFVTNPGLNGLILGVLLVGILLAVLQVVRLMPEVSWVNSFRTGAYAAGKARKPVLLAPMAQLLGDTSKDVALSSISSQSILDSIGNRLDERRDISRYLISLLVFLGLLGCDSGADRSNTTTPPSAQSALDIDTQQTLAQARLGFITRIITTGPSTGPPATPPDNTFELIHYPSTVGPLAAYVTPDPGDGAKRPAIIWITGGDNNTIGDVWSPRPRDNDQSASAFRNAGVVMMFPSQRGGNDNPGRREGFLGEVDDILAARDQLKASGARVLGRGWEELW